jgi:hypothetical protein
MLHIPAVCHLLYPVLGKDDLLLFSNTLMHIRVTHVTPLCYRQHINPLTPELNPSARHCLTRIFTGDLASWTVHFVNICMNNQQIHQLFIQFINYVWYLLHVSALYCHPQGAFLVPSENRILWMGMLCLVAWCMCTTPLDTTCPSTIFYRLLLNWASLRRHKEHSLRMAM